MKLLSFMSRRRLFAENMKLRKEVNKLEKEVYFVHEKYDKFKRELQAEYSDMDKRNNTLSKDNRKLIAIDRKKDRQIIELKRKLKESQEGDK